MSNQPILFFSDMNRYNSYADKKYTKSSSYTGVDPELLAPFTEENGYKILVVLVRNNGTNHYTFQHDIFSKDAKGFFLGTLNYSREYLVPDISSIEMSDGEMTLTIDNLKFRSFEIGILVDPIFNTRGSETLTKVLAMLSS